MIVMKFGGTSTQDAPAIANVVEIVKSHLHQKPIVVVSAIAQATNMLEKIGKFASEKNDREARESLTQLFSRHYTIIDQLIRHITRNRNLRSVLDATREEIETIIKGVTILHELTPRTLDTLYSYGELLSSRIVSVALQDHGIQSEWVDTKDFMFTDENFTRATPYFDIVEEKLKSNLLHFVEKGIVPVTQGFIGITLSGRRTTMGRESSDYSAAVIGAALDVDDIQIWTDVDGVLTADPAVVPDAKKVKVLSFKEAYELSYFGAKVLHSNTMLPAIEKSIPIHIYNSRRPKSAGTLVTAAIPSADGILKSIAYKRNITVISITPFKRIGQYIFWEHIQNVFTKHGIIILTSVTAEYGYSFAAEEKQITQALLQDLNEIGVVSVSEKKCIISVLGSNISRNAGVINRIFSSISDFNLSMISFGASQSSINIVLEDDDTLDAVRGIHSELFDELFTDDIFEVLEHASKK
ncbi:MAG: aspartate kinase [Ignavibacteriales bacterium]|nr:aspartate kinase [Ignavibacteriales bacterium]